MPRNTAEIHQGWMRGNRLTGRIPEEDRALPGPSPAANLGGFWKDFDMFIGEQCEPHFKQFLDNPCRFHIMVG
jgi:hypothetical protein